MGEQGVLYDDTVALVPLEDEHVPVMAGWINDAAVTQFLRPLRGISLAEEREWLKQLRQSDKDKVFGIVRRADSRLVGNVGLHRISSIHHRAVYGIMIGERDCWGQGLGTAAGRLMLDYGFNCLNRRRILLQVIEYNVRGIKSYERLGFQHEGRLRQHEWQNGAFHDMLYMGILRDEFNALWADWRKAQQQRYGIEEQA